MKVSKLRRLGLNVILDAVLNVAGADPDCSTWLS